MSSRLVPKNLPAGHKRREAQKIVTDQLAEQADKSAVTGADVAALTPEEELQYVMQEIGDIANIPNKQPGWVYRWVYVGAQGRDTLQLTKHRIEGWRPISSNDPEFKDRPESLNPFGMIQIGDVVAMKIPAGRKEALDKRDALNAAAKQSATLDEAKSLAAEAQEKLGIKVTIHDNIDQLERAQPEILGKMEASSKFNRMVRQGNIPGVPLTTQSL